jgi:hypothetical protein
MKGAMVTARKVVLMVSILLMGTLLGGIVYSHIVYFPVYLSALTDSSVLVNGPYALHEERFWLLIHPLGDPVANHHASAELENSRAAKTPSSFPSSFISSLLL